MRQPEKGQLGIQGEAAVKHQFTKLGWAVGKPEPDLATDLLMLPRDNRLFDLGLIVGAQVKAGDHYFREPVRDDTGAITGWWFRDDDREYVDSWQAHAVPHIVVLHDHHTETSYWAHVTAKSIVSTGKGAKVFVPRENTIDVHHRDALLSVAATVRPASTWEGTAWTGAGDLAPVDLLRHALLVPRLVAPHRNTGFDPVIGQDQAVALLVEARLDEIDQFARRHSQVPALAEAAHSPDWAWRFVGAFGARITTGSIDQLLAVVVDAPSPPARAAATVVAATALLERARPDEALDLLQTTLERNDNTPVDQAWLTLQHARACLEIGRIDDARSDTVQVQRIRLSHANDVTATAIAGTAARLLFTLSDWGTQDVQEAISGLDTTAVWWRSQRVAAGSTAVIEREFTTWTHRSAVVFHAEDTPNNRLLTASLLASHLGDHSAWRTLDSLNAKQALLRVGRASDPDQVRELLTTLRTSGDDKGLDLAVRRLVANGPAAAVTAAAAEIDLERWTHTTSSTNLTLLRRGGDVLDQPTASAAVRWLLATLVAPGDFLSRTRPAFKTSHRLIDTLAGVLQAAPPHDRFAVTEFVLALPAQDSQTIAASWAGVIRALPARTWTSELASRAARAAGAHHDDLRLALLGAAAPTDDGARQQLLSEICGSNALDALAAFGDVSALPDDVAGDLIAVVESRITKQIIEARQGSWGSGPHDVGRALLVLNSTHPNVAQWGTALCPAGRTSGGRERQARRLRRARPQRRSAGSRRADTTRGERVRHGQSSHRTDRSSRRPSRPARPSRRTRRQSRHRCRRHTGSAGQAAHRRPGPAGLGHPTRPAPRSTGHGSSAQPPDAGPGTVGPRRRRVWPCTACRRRDRRHPRHRHAAPVYPGHGNTGPPKRGRDSGESASTCEHSRGHSAHTGIASVGSRANNGRRA
ncbi:hypothetical protein Lesp02_02640 [Lentzea sp. NBRC 105346]|nr:DUF4365 domain-containing protein [Lentzea sp. NBRC 105346]GLZ28074.1 hypothetical protein Lesp02_02640 [Lentzea sp. NBRC 105346]